MAQIIFLFTPLYRLNPVPCDVYLHSTMIRLIDQDVHIRYASYINLHSTMIRLIGYSGANWLIIYSNLHSTMIRLIVQYHQYQLFLSDKIYIPQWLD